MIGSFANLIENAAKFSQFLLPLYFHINAYEPAYHELIFFTFTSFQYAAVLSLYKVSQKLLLNKYIMVKA